MSVEEIDVYDNIVEWFNRLYQIVDRAIFQMLPEEAEQKRIAEDFLRRDADAISSGTVSHDASIYKPVTRSLCALRKLLGGKLSVEDWQGAVQSVLAVKHKLAEARSDGAFAAMHISPVELFHNEYVNALKNAGLVTDFETHLSDQNQQASRVHAYQTWGPRYLLVAALEFYLAGSPEGTAEPEPTEGLRWLGRQIARLHRP